MRSYVLALAVLSLSGCKYDFDTGSPAFTTGFGKHIQLSCLLDNMNALPEYSLVEKSSTEYLLDKPGVLLSLDIELTGNEVTSYTFKSKMEKSKDGYIHNDVHGFLMKGCEP